MRLYNTQFAMDMSISDFIRLRKKVAVLLDKDLGKAYSKLGTERHLQPEQLREIHRVVDQIAEIKDLDSDVLGFLKSSLEKGKVTPVVCKKIYTVVENYDDNRIYGKPDSNNTFSYFKEMLEYSYKNRANVVWQLM